MIEYKCPYCGKYKKTDGTLFKNWKSVRNHIPKCNLDTKEYTVDEYYGPIKLNIINSYQTINQFRKDYPNCKFHPTAWGRLRKQGKIQLNKYWTEKDCILSIQNFVKENNQIPKRLDFNKNTNLYPSTQITDKYFGSWNKAIEAAGFSPNIQNGFGVNTYGKDGILYDSGMEAYFVDNFLFEKYSYVYYKPYGNGWYFDFYIKELDLYIEIDGGFTDQVDNYRIKMNNKIQFCKDNNLNLKVLTKLDVYNKDYTI